MKTRITLQNYRCFVQPVSFEIGEGFTAFLGQNNAGKSTAMRFLYEFRPLLHLLGHPSGNLINALNSKAEKITALGLVDADEAFSNLNRAGLSCRFEFTHEDGDDTHLPHALTAEVQRDFRVGVTVETSQFLFGGNSKTVGFSKPGRLGLSDQPDVWADLTAVHALMRDLEASIYVGPFRNAINVGSNSSYLDIAVGEEFIRQFRLFKTGGRKANNLAITSLIEDIRAVFGFESFNVEPTEDNKSFHLTVNGKPYKQHELGSGLMQFVLVLANAAVRKPSYVLIDEPELNLHPALQLSFLTTLGRYASSGVVFSTHSIGLARSAAERIYVVQRKREGDSLICPIGAHARLAEFIGEMSFSSHKELGFEKILLVEGPHDVTTMQQFLRKMGKDHSILLLSLGGRINGDMAQELEEVKRISTNIAALIDSEKTRESEPLSDARRAFVELCSRLDIDCHVLGRRATENYLSESALQQTLGPSLRALSNFQRMGDADCPRWPKAMNWKVASNMTREEIASTDLGVFLERI